VDLPFADRARHGIRRLLACTLDTVRGVCCRGQVDLEVVRRAQVPALLRDFESESVGYVEGEEAAEGVDPEAVLSLSHFAALKLAKVAVQLGSVLAPAARRAHCRGLVRKVKRASALLASRPLCRHFHYNPLGYSSHRLLSDT